MSTGLGYFGLIRPELKSAAGEPIRFTSEVALHVDAVVERQSHLPAILGGLQTAEAQTIRINEHRLVTVEFAAEVNASYEELRLHDAHLRPSSS